MHASQSPHDPNTTPQHLPRRRLGKGALLVILLTGVFASWLAGTAFGHGDTAPQPVNTGSLPKLGTDWLEADPFRTGEHHDEAVRVGARGYNANCARCHGLEAVSGGIAPDLRLLKMDCGGDEDCFKDMDGYYLETVRKGRTRDGRVYMPPFEDVISQEAMWAILTYIDTRPQDD